MSSEEQRVAANRAGGASMTYGDYLCLDVVLTAQHTRSEAHDELLFIMQHQTMELWMKLLIHELDGASAMIAADRVRESFKMLTRASRVFEQMASSWQVLRTLTPQEYLEFRDDLGDSSGFQSWQYRSIEFLLGNKSAAMLAAHGGGEAVLDELERRLRAPDLYDVVLGYLARNGHPVPAAVLNRDLTVPHVANDELQAIWATVYHNPHQYWDLYELAEKLVDLEDHFRQWRFNHVTTVERIIGAKPGTGGTSGVDYLRRQLDVVLFADLWQVRSTL